MKIRVVDSVSLIFAVKDTYNSLDPIEIGILHRCSLFCESYTRTHAGWMYVATFCFTYINIIGIQRVLWPHATTIIIHRMGKERCRRKRGEKASKRLKFIRSCGMSNRISNQLGIGFDGFSLVFRFHTHENVYTMVWGFIIYFTLEFVFGIFWIYSMLCVPSNNKDRKTKQNQ